MGADLSRFCKLFGIDGLPNLPANRYESAVAKLRQKNPAAAEAFLTGGK